MSNTLINKPREIRELEKTLNIEILNEQKEPPVSYFTQDDDEEVIELFLFNINKEYAPNLNQFKSLIKLQIQYSNISHITSLISLTPTLQYLSLANNKNLDHIWEVGLIENLKYLDITGTQIWDISPLNKLLKNEAFELKFDQDKIIYPPIQKEQLQNRAEILEWFGHYEKLTNYLIDLNLHLKETTLDLGFCGITDLSLFPKLFECKHLETLILSNEWATYDKGEWSRGISSNKEGGYPNNIFRIPNQLQSLKKLKRVYFGGDWKTGTLENWNRWRIQHFRIFSKLINLEYINVSNNEIGFIAGLNNLQNLKTIHANNNFISKVLVTEDLLKVRECFLSNNFISNVDFLNKFPNVETIDLHSNSLKDLQNIRPLIKKLNVRDTKWALGTISVAHNKTLKLPPLGIIANGMEAVMDYFDRWDREQELDLPPVINNDLKIVLLGNSGVGKSTLAEWLTKGVVDPSQKSTEWFRQIPWKEKVNDRNYNLRLFDFGGQEYYHDTHYMFFTLDTIYLMLWDTEPHDFRKMDNNGEETNAYPIEYWLDSISYFTNKRKIASDEAQIRKLVRQKENSLTESKDPLAKRAHSMEEFNTLVLQSKVDNFRKVEFLNQNKLVDSYKWIADFSNFSVFEDRGLISVKQKILELLQDMSVLQRPLLGTWGAIKEKIEKNGNKRKNEFTIRKFQNFCNKIIQKIPELETASDEKVQRLKFDRNNTLNFINYLSSIGLILYFPENKVLKDKVFINQNHLVKHIHIILSFIKSKNGNTSKEEIYSKNFSSIKTNGISTILDLMIHFKIIFKHPLRKDVYIAPLYLPAKPSKGIQLFLSHFKKPIFQYQFKGFIHRYVVLEFFSSFGSKILNDESSELDHYYWKNGIVLKNNPTDEIILVLFNNDNSEKDFKGYINIYSLTGKNGSFTNEVVLELDKITADRNVEKAICAHDGRCIPLKELNDAARDENYVFKYGGNYYKLVDFKDYLEKPLKMKNLFISYSKEDLTVVDEFKKHLSALQRDGKVGHWYCTELIAGEEWDESIKRHFEAADIICFMVSPNFMHTDYIFEYEIKKAIERRANDKTFKIVPIILDFCRWTTEKYNLGKYTALPYMATPISDFDNKNMAWYVVTEALRVMIEEDSVDSGEDFYTSERLPKDVREIYRRISRKEIH